MRKAKPKKRIILPDPKFGDVRVTKFVNHLMYDGKKNTSYRIFYSALDLVGKKMASEEKTPLEIWKAALEKITPQVNPPRPQRVGFNEEHDHFRSQAWRQDYGRQAGC